MTDAHDAPHDEAAAVRETHVGVVFLLGDRAYKLKKPVRTGFLDFSTPDRRFAALRRELELNRRLAPDVYLGISGITAPIAVATDEPAGIAEHMLVMRRMPASRRLATLVQDGEPVATPLRDLARQMAVFHAKADRSARIDREGGLAALRDRWIANLDQTRALPGSVIDPAVVDEVADRAMRFLDGREPLLADRVAHGRIIDGHGDLIADDVFCLDDGPRVLDCLEFDDLLRYVDALDDVAFLAMDLERLGCADLATRFLDDYVEFSGDPAPPALRHHYIAYRAFVRAKVACLRHEQGDPESAPTARHYADITCSHLRAGAVRLALVGGLPGTGKSTIASGLADRFGAVLLSSDRIRKELAGLDPATPAPDTFQHGLYSHEHTDAVYRELLHRAGRLLARGESVILDASWTDARHRRDAADLAAATCSDIVALECRAPAELAARRIVTRDAGASDATPAVASAMAAAADPWPEAFGVDTSVPIAQSRESAASAW